jgi:hypothetical protein
MVVKMSATGSAPRARVSRETRRLLGVAAIALMTLSLLARLRLPEAPLAPNPVSPLLAQLTPAAPLAELARELGQVAGRVRSSLAIVGVPAASGSSPQVALRWSPGVAVTLTDSPPSAAAPSGAMTHDRPTGLTLVPVGGSDATAAPRAWEPSAPDAAQALVATMPARDGIVAVEPVFVTTWKPRPSSAWRGNVWTVDASIRLLPGSFLFTSAGDLAGVVATDADALVVVPAPLFYSAIEGLSAAAKGAGSGWVGLRVATLSATLSKAVGIESGVIVLEVDSGSPAIDAVSIGDVITRVNDTPVGSTDAWSAIADRLRVGDVMRAHVEGAGGSRDIQITAAAAPAPPPPALGLGLRRVDRQTRVTSVDPGSSAHAAGLRAGDVVVKAGTVLNPTPAELRREFATDAATPLLLIFARDGVTQATTLGRR